MNEELSEENNHNNHNHHHHHHHHHHHRTTVTATATTTTTKTLQHESTRTIAISSPSTSLPTSTISSPQNSEASTSVLSPEISIHDDDDIVDDDDEEDDDFTDRSDYQHRNSLTPPSRNHHHNHHINNSGNLPKVKSNTTKLEFSDDEDDNVHKDNDNSDDYNPDRIHNRLETSREEMGSNEYYPDGSKKQKLGYRKVEHGIVTYKNIESQQIIGSIQIGIQHSIGSLASKPERDVLFNDFNRVEAVSFPRSGSQTTPAHIFDDFTFTTYTPNAFRHFRDLFGIQPDDYMLSMCTKPLIELSNPGASGSMFFRTHDDRFILKTVEKNECTFLLKLLAGYYLNLSQNPDTLLPKFYGLYTYECSGRNIRLIVMNNLLPSNVKIHQKYDLKGSTLNRKASKDECKKSSPTYKDLDFLEHHNLATIYRTKSQMNLLKNIKPNNSAVIAEDDATTGRGLLLAPNTYDMLVDILNRDCRVLESFAIMDYSLLVAVYNHDRRSQEISDGIDLSYPEINYDDDDELPVGAIRATNGKGERLLLFVGVIDILQSYRLVKKLEHAWKSILYDGKTVSVVKPKFYASRFLDFMTTIVFGREEQNETIDKRLHYYRYAENLKTGSLQRMRKFGSMLR